MQLPLSTPPCTHFSLFIWGARAMRRAFVVVAAATLSVCKQFVPIYHFLLCVFCFPFCVSFSPIAWSSLWRSAATSSTLLFASDALIMHNLTCRSTRSFCTASTAPAPSPPVTLRRSTCSAHVSNVPLPGLGSVMESCKNFLNLSCNLLLRVSLPVFLRHWSCKLSKVFQFLRFLTCNSLF